MATKQRISSPHVQEPPPQTWSNGLVVGNQVFIAGMTSRTGTEVVGGASMYGQARAVFTKIRHLMEAAGGRMDDIVKVVIYVTDITRRGLRETDLVAFDGLHPSGKMYAAWVERILAEAKLNFTKGLVHDQDTTKEEDDGN